MNRREALSALMALPGVTRITRADLKPSDVIVIESDEFLTIDVIERLKATVELVWPGHRVAVFSRGVKMKIVSEHEND